MPPADTPDFDSMSPEEVMAWMESLAKRQGASEGFTTEADMDIAEIDPDTVQIDEPGYIPFGEESKVSKEPVAAQPAPQPEPGPEAEPDEDEELELETSGMDWLESLAADQAQGFPEMDLAALSAAIEETVEEEDAEPAPANPMQWLESLAENQGEIEEFDLEAEETESAVASVPGVDLSGIEDPLAAGIDPMLWLESLAKRQGASPDELTTAADMDVPTPENAVDTGPGYTDFSIERESSPGTPTREPARAEETADPAAWVESMATASEPETPQVEAMSDSDIEAALSRGEHIPPDQMEQFFSRQLDRGLSREDVQPDMEEDFDLDAPPVPAELPDWLLEQVQAPDEMDEVRSPDAELPQEASQPALVDEIIEPPNVEDLPDWLQEDAVSADDLSLESIFESTEVPGGEPEYDSSDPWVQAFAEEAAADPDEVPEWYERNLQDPERIASVEGLAVEDVALEDANLPPETDVPAGEPEAVPVWIGEEPDTEPAAEMPDWLSEATSESEDDEHIPDWLADAEVDISPEEIPDWLRDTVELEDTGEETIIIPAETQAVEPESAPEPVRPPAPVSPAEPVSPVPAPPVPVAEVNAALTTARDRAGSGDLEGSLQEYERVIRANTALDDVTGDLMRLADRHSENPAVYRVLGDSLMRQGKLQAALDTYRKALNQL